MPSTHTDLHYHLVFSTAERRGLIADAWGERLHGYLGGLVRGLGGVAEQVGGTRDHIHILARLRATHQVSDILQKIKAGSSGWIHKSVGLTLFAWQRGYGAFTVGWREIDAVARYIKEQQEHHRTKSFEEELRALLEEAGISYDERYLI